MNVQRRFAALAVLLAFLVVAPVVAATQTVALVPGDAATITCPTTPSTSQGNTSVVVTCPKSPLLWHANHEAGDLREWYAPEASGVERNNGGGKYNSNTSPGWADSWVTGDQAHSGYRSLALTVNGACCPSQQGTRLFRWRVDDGSDLPVDAYYTTWFYFPQVVHVGLPNEWWNVFQWKSRDAAGNSVPMTSLQVWNRPDPNSMRFYLATRQGNVLNQITPTNIPVGRWFKVEARYVRSSTNQGRVTVWQDGNLLFDVANVQTQIINDLGWSIANYADTLSPANVTIYADDAAISTARLP